MNELIECLLRGLDDDERRIVELFVKKGYDSASYFLIKKCLCDCPDGMIEKKLQRKLNGLVRKKVLEKVKSKDGGAVYGFPFMMAKPALRTMASEGAHRGAASIGKIVPVIKVSEQEMIESYRKAIESVQNGTIGPSWSEEERQKYINSINLDIEKLQRKVDLREREERAKEIADKFGKSKERTDA